MSRLQLVKFESGTSCLVNGSEWIEKSKFGIVFLNSGIVHMAGPNGLYKKLAERLRHEGFPTFRFDFSGMSAGKEESDEYTFDNYQINETAFLLEEIKQKFSLKKFILLGLCSGGDIAFRMAKSDYPMVIGTVLINAYLLPRESIKKIHNQAKSNLEKRLYKRHLWKPKKWLGLLRKNPTQLLQILKKFTVKKAISPIEKLADTNDNPHPFETQFTKPTILIYSEGSVSYEVFKMKFSAEFKKMVEHGANNPDLMYFAFTDHNFATVISQLKLFDAVVKWLNEIKLKSQPPNEKPAIENVYH